MKKICVIAVFAIPWYQSGRILQAHRKNETSIYDRQYRIGYEPESFTLDEMMNVLETTITEN